MSNRLSNESSPYLKQHAQNPVDWYPWGKEALDKAQRENKLIIVSVGYSACHWCHVMEHETFEDQHAAEVMNEHFVCIKVDREERPDIDQIYLLAVQLMSGHAGWPLNCICLPDQRPIYGGTYFRKDDWVALLLEISRFWKEKPEDAVDYAEKLTQGLSQQAGFNVLGGNSEYTVDALDKMLKGWTKLFDLENGGYKGAPKFPLPNNYLFLLRMSFLSRNASLESYVRLTLDKMSGGGIYDHIGGGFARYSVDGRWHVPHFEKMLYDNAQLISLYAEAYQCFKEDRYKETVLQSVQWLKREMRAPDGGYYSALDADSEGVEGKFYTFGEEELKAILSPGEFTVITHYYNTSSSGNWPEEHTNVFCTGNISLSENDSTILQSAREKVFAVREKRLRPGTDDKVLTAWNALLLKSFCDAYKAIGDEEYLYLATELAEFLMRSVIAGDHSVSRIAGKTADKHIPGFLDDYAAVAEAFIALYEAGLDEKWIYEAADILGYALQHFYDPGTGMFFYTSDTGQELIVRKHEIVDNVVPGSNSIMANVLFKMGHYLQNEEFLEQADLMLDAVFEQTLKYGKEYSNWAGLLLLKIFGVYEVAITGPDTRERLRELNNYYIPNKIVLGGTSGKLPLLRDKFDDKQTRIFVCINRTCTLPVTEVKEALKQFTK